MPSLRPPKGFSARQALQFIASRNPYLQLGSIRAWAFRLGTSSTCNSDLHQRGRLDSPHQLMFTQK